MGELVERGVAAAVAAVMLLTTIGVHAQDEAAPATSGDDSAEVIVRSDKEGVVVAQITGEAFAVGSNGATASAVAWKDVCMAPCSFRTKPGLFTMMTHGEGHVAGRQQMSLAPGPNYFVAKPGSLGLRYGGYALLVVGVTAMVFGGIFAMRSPEKDYANCTASECPDKPKASWPVPLLIGGVVATGVGVGMWVSSGSSIERDSAPPPRVSGTYVPWSLSYRGAF